MFKVITKLKKFKKFFKGMNKFYYVDIEKDDREVELFFKIC